jgi:tetratricopeptide (TPR) repeat protein
MAFMAHTDALLSRARQELSDGQLTAAQATCLEVLGSHEQHPGALEVLGEVLCAAGRYQDAVRVFNALTLMQPQVALHWQNLGTVLRPTGPQAQRQALAAFERALQLGPPNAGLLYNLGVLQMDQLEYGAAYPALRDAAALAPLHATFRWAYAQCCLDMAREAEALEALEDWQRLQAMTVDILVLIALQLLILGAMQLAQPAVQMLEANPPPAGRAALRWAAILERLHRLDEARAILERVQRSDPDLDHDPERLLLSAVVAERLGDNRHAQVQLRAALGRSQQPLLRHKLLFPLARVCDALGQHEAAFDTAQEAHRSQLAFLARVQRAHSAEQSQIWTLTGQSAAAADIAAWDAAGPAPQDSPIFVVGFPRSGTTLIEQVLDAHPGLTSMDEQPFMLRAVAEVAQCGTDYPRELGKLSEPELDRIRAAYWTRVSKRVQFAHGRRLVDKNPINIIVLPLIRRLFPRAPIVLLIRHPCDTLLSCLLQDFRAPGLAAVCADLPTLATTYARVFDWWYAQDPRLRELSYEMRYEQLTADFNAEVHRLAEFLQLPWHEAMLTPATRARAKGFINTPSYAQVLTPVTTYSVGRWKPYRDHFTDALPALMPWIERWGYGLE